MKTRSLSFISFFIFILAFSASSVKSQSLNNIDSLRNEFKNQKDLELANTVIEIVKFYKNIDVDSSEFYANHLMELSDSLNFPDGILAANTSLINVDFIKGSYFEGIQRALPFLSKDYEYEGYHLADLYLATGNCYSSLGIYKTGVEYYLKSRKIFRELDVKDKINTVSNNLGALYIRLENYGSALDVFSQMDISEGNKALQVTTKVNFGFIYLGLNEYKEAETNFLNVLDFENDVIEVRAKAIASFKLGDLYTQLKEYQKAIKHYNESIRYFSILENEAQKMNPLNGIAQIHFELGELKSAKEVALRSKEIGQKTQTLSELSTVVSLLANIYKEEEDYKKAFEYSVMSRELNDSLNISRRNQEVQILEAEYNFERREQELKREQSIALKNQRIILGGVSSFFLVSLIFIFTFYKSKKNKEKANLLLEDLNKDLKETNNIKNQLFSIIAHDLRNPLSSLYGLVTLLEMKTSSQEEMEKLIPELVSQFKHTSTLLNNLLNWSKSQMQGYKILPTKFDIFELFRTNSEVLASRFQNKDISITIDSKNSGFVFADRNMIDVVVLNILSNALKYCDKEDSVIISSTSQSGFVTISVNDSGMGIPKNKIKLLFTSSFYSTSGTRNEAGTGLGLMLCREFIEKNGGKIWVESTFGKGATFYFTLPIHDFKNEA
jgi:signal transduction histidine kinase